MLGDKLLKSGYSKDSISNLASPVNCFFHVAWNRAHLVNCALQHSAACPPGRNVSEHSLPSLDANDGSVENRGSNANQGSNANDSQTPPDSHLIVSTHFARRIFLSIQRDSDGSVLEDFRCVEYSGQIAAVNNDVMDKSGMLRLNPPL